MDETDLETQRQPVPRLDDGERSTAPAFLTFARECVLKKVDSLAEDGLGRPRTVRWVVAHMRSEVARQAGHADILREQVDQVTGR